MSNNYQFCKLIDSRWIEQKIIPAKSRRFCVKGLYEEFGSDKISAETFKKGGVWKLRLIK